MRASAAGGRLLGFVFVLALGASSALAVIEPPAPAQGDLRETFDVRDEAPSAEPAAAQERASDALVRRTGPATTVA